VVGTRGDKDSKDEVFSRGLTEETWGRYSGNPGSVGRVFLSSETSPPLVWNEFLDISESFDPKSVTYRGNVGLSSFQTRGVGGGLFS
jgi:hypothetical protein